jgi:predicted PilT family ATPase
MANYNILDHTILSLSETDHLRVRDMCEGTLITGAPGSGKSSTAGKQLAYGLLQTPGMGGLVLTAKSRRDGALDTVRRILRPGGRSYRLQRRIRSCI